MICGVQAGCHDYGTCRAVASAQGTGPDRSAGGNQRPTGTTGCCVGGSQCHHRPIVLGVEDMMNLIMDKPTLGSSACLKRSPAVVERCNWPTAVSSPQCSSPTKTLPPAVCVASTTIFPSMVKSKVQDDRRLTKIPQMRICNVKKIK